MTPRLPTSRSLRHWVRLAIALFALLNWLWCATGRGWWLDLSRQTYANTFARGQTGRGIASEHSRLILSWRWSIAEVGGPFVSLPSQSLGPALSAGEVEAFDPLSPGYNTARLDVLSQQARMGHGFHRLGLTVGWEPSWSANRTSLNRGIAIHWAWIAGLALLPTIVRMSRRVFRRRIDPTRCRVCGYDLRASPERCPECGTAVATE